MKNPDANVRLKRRGGRDRKLAFQKEAFVDPFLAGGKRRVRICCCCCWYALEGDGALTCRIRETNFGGRKGRRERGTKGGNQN
jgi:hypothetical protein